MADINFEGNYVHNPIGYLTVGGPTEKACNYNPPACPTGIRRRYWRTSFRTGSNL